MMRDLGTLGGHESRACGVNAQGLIVGSAQTADGTWHAFLWSSDSGMKQLDVPGAVSSWGIAINGAGQVTGSYADAEGKEGAFIGTDAKGFQIISTPYRLCGAEDINAAGQVLLTSAYHDDDDTHVMVWSENDGLRDLGSPYPSCYVSVNAIANAGDIIGWVLDAGPMFGGERAFILSQDGEATQLPGIGPPGAHYIVDCHAFGANGLGQIVGSMDCTETETHAWLWTPRIVDPSKEDSVRIDISYTITGLCRKRRSMKIPHEEIEFSNREGHVLCRFKAVDAWGRPKEMALTLDLPMSLDSQAAYTISYEVVQHWWGYRRIYKSRPRESPSHQMTDLGTLDGLRTMAWSINNLGQVVGSAHSLPGQDERERAFFWSKDTRMLDLGTLGGQKARALGINDAGTAVGWAEDSQGRKRAFAWNQQTSPNAGIAPHSP